MSPTPPDRKRKQPPTDSNPAKRDWAVTAEGSPPIYVTEINQNDVLMGRGKPIITNEGNKRFRCLVRERKDEYSSTSRTHIKEAIARAIITEVSNRKGHFLELVQRAEASAAGFGEKSKVWKVVNVKVALNKVKQSLRDKEYVKSEHRDPVGLMMPDPHPSSQLLQPAEQNPPSGFPSLLDDQRRLNLMQQHALMEQERNSILLRAQQLQGLQQGGFPAYNANLVLQQASLGSANNMQGLHQFPLGFNPNQLNPPEQSAAVGGAARVLSPADQQRYRDFSMSRQLMMGQNPPTNMLLGNEYMSFPTVSQVGGPSTTSGVRGVREATMGTASSLQASSRQFSAQDLASLTTTGLSEFKQEQQPLGNACFSPASASTIESAAFPKEEFMAPDGDVGAACEGRHENDSQQDEGGPHLKSENPSDKTSSASSSQSGETTKV